MSGFIIYALDDANNKVAYEIYNIECTVGDLLDDILKINRCWEVVVFNEDELNYMNKDTMLADIGLGSECTVIIKDKVLSENEQKIVSDYGERALEEYKIFIGNTNMEAKYNNFTNEYAGYFSDTESFVNYCLKYHQSFIKFDCMYFDRMPSDIDKLYEIFVTYFWRSNNHYFIDY